MRLGIKKIAWVIDHFNFDVKKHFDIHIEIEKIIASAADEKYPLVERVLVGIAAQRLRFGDIGKSNCSLDLGMPLIPNAVIIGAVIVS